MAIRSRIAIVLVLVALWPAPIRFAAAGTLAPAKPSDLRVVQGFYYSPICAEGAGRRVDTEQKPDGTFAPFSIPAKKVFVITGWDWYVSGGASSPGSLTAVSLVLVDATGTSVSTLSFGRAIAGTDGSAGSTVATPTGVVVKPGAVLCYIQPIAASVFGVVVRGFIAKDK